VGKSSLYNALLGQERAIVTEEPGTTRDALECTVQMGGFPFRLVDTAGLRESAERIERLGIEIARRYLDRANVILLCVPVDEGPSPEDIEFARHGADAPIVIVETKSDLVEDGSDRVAGSRAVDERWLDGPEVAGRVRVSVETGAGLDQLRQLLPELVYSAVVGAGSDDPVITRRRHARALEAARDEVERFRDGLAEGLPAEVAATHLRSAETALEELLGTVSVDDVLDVVFREFCVGK
jgi:tRNA modification GTPase